MSLGTAALYLDTGRRMRPRQLLGRARRLVPPAALAVGAGRNAAAWRPLAAGLGADPAPQSGPVPPPDETGVFSAVGASRSFGARDFWRDERDGLLFLFQLHGFTELSRYAAGPPSPSGDRFWDDVIASWMASEARARLPGWHPYPTSLRLIAWSAALSSVEGWGSAMRSRLAHEILRQARYLRRTIEHDVGGNHVLKNAAALVFAGAVTGSRELVGTGTGLLRRELGRQILADGGHEERSPSYHRAVAADLRQLAELLRRLDAGERPWLDEAIRSTDRWEAAMRGPDGSLPLLNDAWEGPAASADRSGAVIDLAESGYSIVRRGGEQVIFDAGPVSPPHLPPHAHADVLSFVLWADGRPLVVDPGSYAYTGEWRSRFRSTSYHNTVEVDGRDQCELWGDFRVAFPPRVRALPPRQEAGSIVLTATHDGYRRLADPVEHQRSIVWCEGQGMVVVDLLRARRPHAVRSSLHLAPGVSLQGNGRVGPYSVTALGVGAAVRSRQGHYSPFLGVRRAISVLEDVRDVEPETPFGWSLLRGDRHVVRLDRDRLVLEGGDRPRQAIALSWL